MRMSELMRRENGLKAYAELTAYLDPAEKSELEIKLKQLSTDSLADQELATQIEKGDWMQVISKNDTEKFPLHALHCLREGLISVMSFSTSQMFFNVYTHPHHSQVPRIVSIFDDGKINADAKKMISETMDLAPKSYKTFVKSIDIEDIDALNQYLGFLFHSQRDIIKKWCAVFGPMLSDYDFHENEETFYKILLTMPASEHSFLLLPDPCFENGKNTALTATLYINMALGFNMFSRLIVDQKPMCMIPSRGMMQAHLLATRDHNDIPRPIYRFGLSSVRGLFETMKSGGRDMFQAYAPLSNRTPERIDNSFALSEFAEAEMHDFYHQAQAANVPSPDARFFAKIAEELFAISEKNTSCKMYAEKLIEFIIDMEHTTYNRNFEKPGVLDLYPRAKSAFPANQNKFWHAFFISDQAAAGLMALSYSEKITQREALAKHLVTWLMEKEEIENLLQYQCPEGAPHISLVHKMQIEIRRRLEQAHESKKSPRSTSITNFFSKTPKLFCTDEFELASPLGTNERSVTERGF